MSIRFKTDSGIVYSTNTSGEGLWMEIPGHDDRQIAGTCDTPTFRSIEELTRWVEANVDDFDNRTTMSSFHCMTKPQESKR